MHLPAEIIDKILRQLINITQSEFYPFNCDGYMCRRVLWNDLICTDQDADHRIHLDESIFSLRLVSREWNQGASVIIAKYHTWKIDLSAEASLQRALSCLPNDTDSSHNDEWLMPTHEIVRKLMIKPGKELSSKTAGDHPEYHHTKEYLLKLCSRLGYLESLILSFPSNPPNDSEPANPETVDEIINTVATCVLETDSLNSLVDLQLKVPTTYHAGQFLKLVAGDRAKQLHHLLVEILDDSGKSGSREYLANSYFEDSDLDGTAEESDDDSEVSDVDGTAEESDDECEDSEDDRSPIQRRYPNRRHQQELWDFISSCTSLETLSIQGTHFLDLNKLKWQPSAAFPGLRVLNLGRIYANISSIRQLLQPSDKKSTPRLQKIVLDDVKIPEDGGVWGELADFLTKNCVHLDLLFLYNLSYFTAYHRGVGLSSPEDGTLIDSCEDDDTEPLNELIHTFADKCGSSDTWPYWMREMGEDLDILEDYEEK